MNDEITKKCLTCGEDKKLVNFYNSPSDSRASGFGTSTHCISCHDEGFVPNGYGDPRLGPEYKEPSWVN